MKREMDRTHKLQARAENLRFQSTLFYVLAKASRSRRSRSGYKICSLYATCNLDFHCDTTPDQHIITPKSNRGPTIQKRSP